MSELLERVEESICARGLFRRGQSILIAVSGGLDSMVLLHLLLALAPRYRWRLKVAHFNHQLRGRSSTADERLVRQTAARLKLLAVVERADVRGFAQYHDLSIEMAARHLRHQFLAHAARSLKLRTIALAHHADDQVELFFLRLLRGAGGEGLGGMKWLSPSPVDPQIELARPLLDFPKSALRTYAAERKIRFREDQSNVILEIQRNRIRHELLPLLRKHYQPAIDKTILRVMEIAGPEAEFVSQTARVWLQKTVNAGRESQSKSEFDNLPMVVQRRGLQMQLHELRITPDFALIEELRLNPGKPVNVKKMGRGGVATRVVRSPNGLLRLLKPASADFNPATVEVDLDAGAGEFRFEGVRFQWQVTNGSRMPKSHSAGIEIFDADQVGPGIVLRHWRAGDRFQPIGMPRPVKLQDLFTNQKVPRNRRHELVVATTGQNEPFWVEGLRISERFKLSNSTNRCLLWRWRRL